MVYKDLKKPATATCGAACSSSSSQRPRGGAEGGSDMSPWPALLDNTSFFLEVKVCEYRLVVLVWSNEYLQISG